MKGMIPPTQWITVKETLKNISQSVLNTLFVPIPEDENIQLRTCQVYGIPGTGKTSLYRWFGFEGLKHYTNDNINLIESTNLDVLLDSIEPVPVNFLFLEDAGLETQSAGKELIAKFSRVRHIHGDVLEDKDKERKGIDDVFFAVQDPFLLEKKLRSTLHVEIWKNAPTNDYDKGILVKNIGREALKQLELINKRVFQQHKYEYLSHCVARAVDSVGYLKYNFILAHDSVLKKVSPESPSSSQYKPKPFIPTQNMSLYEVIVEVFTDFFSQRFKNEEWIICAFVWRFLTPLNLTWSKIYKKLKQKYNMKNKKTGEIIRQDSVTTLANRFNDDTDKETGETWEDKIDNTSMGEVLEVAIEKYFNSRGLQQTFLRFGGEGKPDLLLATDPKNFDSLAVNAKYRGKTASSYTVECSPEYKYKHCWIAFYTPEQGLWFYKNEENKEKETISFEEGLSVDDFIKEIEKIA